jgi:NDP-sugar pyrophosphorylase family protein
VFGAIIVVGAEETTDGNASVSTRPAGEVLRGGNRLAGVEILGRSLLEVTVENLQSAGVGLISVLTQGSITENPDVLYSEADSLSSSKSSSPRGLVELLRVEDVAASVGSKLNDQRNSGIDRSVVIRMGAYVEVDLNRAIQFHHEERQAAIRLADADGPLDIWIVETSDFSAQADVLNSLATAGLAACEVNGYVNRLAHPRDLRQLAADSLAGRCRLRPRGSEIQPGIWVGEGAQVHRGARVVAPAFIGRGSIIEDDCTIADCSAIESDCEIDCGSTLSDVSLLPNTYIGIGLNIRHSVVNGGTLLSLEHDVTLEISDPGVMRQNKAPHKDVSRPSPVDVEVPGMLFTPAEEAAN